MRPFFSFYGGKWRVARHYPSPDPGLPIVEPFAGSAGYSMRHAARDVVLVDKDPVIAATWRYLISVTSRDVMALPDMEPGQDVRDLAVSEEARHLIGWWLQRGGAAPNRTLSAWGRQPKHRRQFWGPHVRSRIAAQVDLIRHWRIIEGTYRDAPNIAATWFVDPPYVKAGRHYRHGSRAIDYSDLAAFCRAREGLVIACENTGADWLPFEAWREIKANESKTGGKISAEAIWTNRAGRLDAASCAISCEAANARTSAAPTSEPIGGLDDAR